jgi:hypothetical protein
MGEILPGPDTFIYLIFRALIYGGWWWEQIGSRIQDSGLGFFGLMTKYL